MCTFFNFNANSPVIEGYRVWFNDYYNFLKRFFHEIGHDYEKILRERSLGEIPLKERKLEENEEKGNKLTKTIK